MSVAMMMVRSQRMKSICRKPAPVLSDKWNEVTGHHRHFLDGLNQHIFRIPHKKIGPHAAKTVKGWSRKRRITYQRTSSTNAICTKLIMERRCTRCSMLNTAAEPSDEVCRCPSITENAEHEQCKPYINGLLLHEAHVSLCGVV